jgi:ketosteroid isomerase-like protein
MQESDLKTAIAAYLEAYDQRALSTCMDFFAQDATILFAMGTYRGHQAIEKWHQDRFAADLRVTRVDEVKMDGDTVIVDVTATSKVARAWRFDSVAGRVTVVFRQGKIHKAEFGLRTALPIERW